MNIILASASPRRRELMRIITDKFESVSVDADECILPNELPQTLVIRLARLKAEGVSDGKACAVIGCDTIVELNGQILGKPKTLNEAREMLTALSGREHFVHTGVCVKCNERLESFCESTRVRFAPIPNEALEQYILTAEPYDKAGGYGIQSWAARFITGIDGCFYNVMGLPVAAVYNALSKLEAIN